MFDLAVPEAGRDIAPAPPVEWAARYIEVTVNPREASAGDQGFFVSAQPDIRVAGNKDRYDAADSVRKQLSDKFASQAMGQRCPSPGDVRVHVGSVEIGPNGEAVKLIGEGADVVHRVDQELEKIAHTPGKALKDAPHNVAHEVHKFFHRL